MWDRSRAGARVRERRGRGKGTRAAEHHVLGNQERRDHHPLSHGYPPGPSGGKRSSATRSSDDGYTTARVSQERLVSRTVDLTVRWSAPPPPHTVALGRAVKVAGLFVSLPRTRASSFSRLLVLLRVCPSRRFLRGLRPQCSSTVFRTALLEERPTVRIRSSRTRAQRVLNLLTSLNEDYTRLKSIL